MRYTHNLFSASKNHNILCFNFSAIQFALRLITSGNARCGYTKTPFLRSLSESLPFKAASGLLLTWLACVPGCGHPVTPVSMKDAPKSMAVFMN